MNKYAVEISDNALLVCCVLFQLLCRISDALSHLLILFFRRLFFRDRFRDGYISPNVWKNYVSGIARVGSDPTDDQGKCEGEKIVVF